MKVKANEPRQSILFLQLYNENQQKVNGIWSSFHIQ